jgi:hypothetical protein
MGRLGVRWGGADDQGDTTMDSTNASLGRELLRGLSQLADRIDWTAYSCNADESVCLHEIIDVAYECGLSDAAHAFGTMLYRLRLCDLPGAVALMFAYEAA